MMKIILIIALLCSWVMLPMLESAQCADNIEEAFEFLKARKDKDALDIAQRIIALKPLDIDALWVKAEVLRRAHRYDDSERLLGEILKLNPRYVAALITLSYIKYREEKLTEALVIINRALKIPSITKQDRALGYVMLGTINSRRCQKGGLVNKIFYGTQIKYYFLKAKELTPELAEAHLGLGTFYLMAPEIAGGDLDKAIEELNITLRIAPNFATACLRLAQAYKKKGEPEKYNFYLKRAKELDPENEFLSEVLSPS